MISTELIRSSLTTVVVTLVVMQTGGTVFGQDGDSENGVDFDYRLILEDPQGGSDSAVSPDGKWLAFASRRSGNLDVWLASVETGKTRQITTHPATDNEPRWHPDGTKLCFVTQRSGSQDVYVVDLKTGKQTPIASQPFNEDYPSFSRDGSEVCFTGGPHGSREVQVYTFATRKTRKVTRGYGYVGATNFSPDGKRIIFHAYYDNSYGSGKSDLFVVPAHGGKPVNISKQRDIWDYKPNWSFDGDWITFSSKQCGPNFNLWLMRPNGSDRKALTRVEGADLRWSNWTRDGRIGWHRIRRQTGKLRVVDLNSGKANDVYDSDFGIRDLSPSPNGESLLYETNAQIYVMPTLASAKPRLVASGLAPRWRPDSKSVVFLTNRRSKIAIVQLDGGDPVTFDHKPKDWPSANANPWSLDGKQLALITETDSRDQLSVVSLKGGQRKLVEGSDPITSPIWSKDGSRIFFAENRARSVGYYISTKPVIGRAKVDDKPKKDGSASNTQKRQQRGKFSAAPEFVLTDLHGDRQRLSQLTGKVTVLHFWSLYRECEADLKVLQSIHTLYGERGVSVVGLPYSSGSREEVATLLDSVGVDFPTLMCDQRVARQYNVATFPTTFLLDQNGRIRYWMYGILVADHWDQLVQKLLADQG